MWSGQIQSSFSVHVAWLRSEAQLMAIPSKVRSWLWEVHAACKDRDTPSNRKGSRRNCEGAPETADTRLTKTAHSLKSRLTTQTELLVGTTTEGVCTGHHFTRFAIDERFGRCGGLVTCRPIRIPARAETNSTGSPPLVCGATVHSEILSNGYLGKTPFLSAPDRQFSRNRVFRSQHAVSGQLGGWATSPVAHSRAVGKEGFGRWRLSCGAAVGPSDWRWADLTELLNNWRASGQDEIRRPRPDSTSVVREV